MAIPEGTTTIAGLNQGSPTDQDLRSYGDDEFRQLKGVLKNIFPGAGGDGFEDQITATEPDLNASEGVFDYLQGLSGPLNYLHEWMAQVATAFDENRFVLSAQAGQVMLFYNSLIVTAENPGVPVGWTQLTDGPNAITDEYMVVASQDTPGVTYGSMKPDSFNHSHQTQDHVLTQDEMPSHTHLLVHTWLDSVDAGGQFSNVYRFGTNQNTSTLESGKNKPHNHGATFETKWTPRCAAVMFCKRDEA